jgi:hypothetical protein
MASAAPAIKERRPAAAEPPLRLKPVSAAPTPARPAVTSSLSASPQAKSFVSSPGDPAEREADRVARQVMEMPAPPVVARGERSAQRVAAPLPSLPRAASPTGTDSAVAAKVRAAATGGAPLSRKTRAFLEPRFRADFSNVMVHTDPVAVRLATELGARAFTYGRHIFFGAGQYNPESRDGLELLAHELTHTIQQSETIQRKEADAAEAPRVTQRTERQASRLGISDVLDYFADAANAIPGYRMFTILIGVNPINMSAVEASAANILRAIVEFLPGGNIITRVLDSYGIFDKVGGWIEGQLKSLGITGSAIRAAINKFLDSLGWRDIFRLGSVWNRAKAIFTDPISRIISFAKGLFAKILEMVQEAVLRPLAALAAQTPFYTLLKAVLGKDPVTGEAYEGGAAEVIGGFMTMIGQQELWQNIQRANAIPRAFNWFKTAMKGLLGIVTSIPGRFMGLLRSLEIMDFVVLPRAFEKIGGCLASFLADFGSWALGTVIDLLKIIVEVVAPTIMPYIAKAAGAFNTILRNPIGFVGNLVRAAMQGFRQFATNFLTHLQASLVGWLTGAMAGANIYIPQGLSLREILKFVLSILGLTWQNIRGKLVRATNETTVVALETGFDIVRTLVTEGPAAAWQKIIEVIGNLKQMAIDAIMDFVKSRVVQAAVTRLLSMLSPAGAFIQAIIAIYNTIMFFVERLRQIAQVAASFIDSIAAIASGNIASAAGKVETTMAGLLTLVISFLARIAGLGRVSDAVTNLINRIRAPIDRALDAVVNWIVTQARRLGAAVMRGARGAAARLANWWRERRRFALSDGSTHNLFFRGNGDNARLILASVELPVEDHLNQAIADTSLSNAARTRARAALAFYQTNLAPLSGRAVPTPPTPALQAKMDAMPENMNRFAEMLRAISSDTDMPMPPAVFGWGGPAVATADLLSNRSSRGGADASSGNPPGWNLLATKGLTTSGARWVRMHMISAAYGGLDVDGNLLPAPTAVNTGGTVRGFERQIEQTLYADRSAADVRAARSLFANLRGRRAVIWLKTSAGGYWPAKNDPANGIVYSANTFARSASFEGGLHIPRGTDWAKDPSPLIRASVPIPEPDFSASAIPNINSIGEPLIARTAGIGTNYAREIIAERGGTPAGNPHTSISNFKQRMRAARTSAGIEITSEFRAALAAVEGAAAAGRLKWRN